MVIAFLEKLQNEYLEERTKSEREIGKIQLCMEENLKLISMLEEHGDPHYESFTPREVNGKNKKKILELMEEQMLLQSAFDSESEKMLEYEKKLTELSHVIKAARQTISRKKRNAQYTVNSESYLVTFLEMQENERRRISRDLHDSSVQSLTGLIHKTELCGKLIGLDPVRCKLELNTVSKTLREVIEDMRQIIYNLRPMSFDDIGLEETIERALNKMEVSESKKISFQVTGDPYQLKPVVGITLFRIIQEGCNNAIRHADASLIQVTLHYESGKISVEIRDNGKGFDADADTKTPRNHSGFGLSVMKERVYLLSGTIKITSKINCGTVIFVEVPVV